MSSEPVNSDATYLHSKSSAKAEEVSPSSPLSSPPITPTPATVEKMAVSTGEVTSADEMPPPPKPDASSKPSTVSRKRSREVVEEEGYLADGLQTAAGPTSTRGKKRGNSADSATTVIKELQSQAQSQLQPDAETLSQKVPPSGQGQASAAAQPAKTKSTVKNAKVSQKPKPAPHQQSVNQEGGGSEYETDTDVSETEFAAESVPEEQIEDFDWEDLELRYHAKIQELGLRGTQLLEEFNELMNYFYIWVETGYGKEVDRSLKRLKTQVAYVQHEEDELEKKRQHYIRVVNAFKTVGVLLDKPNWHQRVVPNRRRISGLRTSIENDHDQSAVSKRLEGSKEIIQLRDWPPHVVDDIDMVKYHYPDHHAARCVIL